MIWQYFSAGFRVFHNDFLKTDLSSESPINRMAAYYAYILYYIVFPVLKV